MSEYQEISWIPYLYAACSIVLSSMAQVLLKVLMRHNAVNPRLFIQPLFYAGFIAYGVSALLWLHVLAKLPLVTAYPLVSLNFVLVAVAGGLVLHEQVSWPMALGLAMIIGGILVIARQ